MSEEGRATASFEDLLVAVRRALSPSEYDKFERSLAVILERILSTRLLSHPRLKDVRDLPAVYGHELPELVTDIALEWGLPAPSREEVLSIRQTITIGYGESTHASPITPKLVAAVMDRCRRQDEQLRCECCGYWFRDSDMGGDRLREVRSRDFVLATRLHAGRELDPLKPKDRTTLHIDHKVPRSAWGQTRETNLQILCEFCNVAKWAYLSPLESMVQSVAVSLTAAMARPDHSSFSAAWCAFAVISHAGECADCRVGPRDAELTAWANTDVWFTPWTADAVCYGCLANRVRSASGGPVDAKTG